ncbi:phospho-N-acetylmuramoyl-pentapeptide-transferase [Holophaga foetida]|uniref:phospho-N-acetylmuramoyl-pentapeptide- transferase n=1 Tax=Holophaga foetida TaxID=35839 RepID=UPI0002474A23|nr:phospho-N-acetylmuramoyl-pentapeptide-transferase [Holophaga foetida]
MLVWLLAFLRDHLPGFSVFKYVTFRAAMAAATAMILSLVVGPWVIETLKRLKLGQHIRAEGPEHHQVKAGTPTMGGVLVLGTILVSTLLWCELRSGHIWVALLSLLGFGMVGAFDDAQKLLKKQNLGLTSRQKMVLLTAISLLVAFLVLHFGLRGANTSQLSMPFFKRFQPDVGIFLVPWIWLVMVGTSNAVNLTDGLDGLAIGGTLVVAVTFVILAYVAGHYKISAYLMVPFVNGGSELAVFMGAMAGASLGFLWFNAHPAEVFMGDTGSLGLGGALATVAIMIKQELLLVIAGGVFVWEAVSVILQVSSFKLRGGKRIFRMAPFHHHLELGGLQETKVVIRLWITAIVCCMLALSSLKLR